MITDDKALTLAQFKAQPISKGELFEDVKTTFDYALPQPWLDAFANFCDQQCNGITYHLILSTTVWAYPESVPFTRSVDVWNAYLAWQRAGFPQVKETA